MAITPITRRATGTTEHFSSGTGASPQTSAGTANVTIQAGDAAVILAITVGVQGAVTSNDLAMTASCGGVSMTALAASEAQDFGNTNSGGKTKFFYLLDPVTAIGSTGTKTITMTATFTTSGAISAR